MLYSLSHLRSGHINSLLTTNHHDVASSADSSISISRRSHSDLIAEAGQSLSVELGNVNALEYLVLLLMLLEMLGLERTVSLQLGYA